jgi:hypothetical protein
MEMDLGGPVWHASVAMPGIPMPARLEAEAVRQLSGVGDPALGEWREWTGRAFHLRRRLSVREAGHVGPVLDIRRTPEAASRAARLGDLLRYAPAEVLAEELGGGA